MVTVIALPHDALRQHVTSTTSLTNKRGGLGAILPSESNAAMKFAMVCASNMNRSMEAHHVLQKHGFEVQSYGVGNRVKLPGAAANSPNVYEFGAVTYEQIFNDLSRKDPELYTRNGLLQMLQRNMQVKRAPEKWQHNRDVFDVVVSFEERVMEHVVEDLQSRPQTQMRPVVVVNLDVKDNHEEAAIAGQQTLRLCQLLAATADWEDHIDDIIKKFERETGRRPMYTICFY